MQTTLALDPGKHSGWAVFKNKRLDAVGLLRGSMHDKAEAFRTLVTKYRPAVTVIELPQVYKQSRQQGDPNDLIGVAVVAGLAVAAFSQTGDVYLVKPHEWKGSTPKKISNMHTLGRLGSDELGVLDDSTAPNSLKHNIIDAVGLGLWKLGRSTR